MFQPQEFYRTHSVKSRKHLSQSMKFICFTFSLITIAITWSPFSRSDHTRKFLGSKGHFQNLESQNLVGEERVTNPKGWFSYNRRHRFDRRCQFKKWSYDWDDYMRTLHKRSLMPAAIGTTAIAWIARVLSGRLIADRGDRSDSGDYMRTSLKRVC